jgi:hypothetical protein
MESMMAACGLDCGPCQIRTAPTDPKAAEALLKWFRSQGWLEDGEGMEQVIERKMYCTGCLGDREAHWSADCWILQCCVDQRSLSNCSECPEFACDRLEEWAGQNDGYRAALVRLREMRKAYDG